MHLVNRGSRSAVLKPYNYIFVLYKCKLSINTCMCYSGKAFSSVLSKIMNSSIADDEVLCRGTFAQSIVYERP